jgi:hypothetical protein
MISRGSNNKQQNQTAISCDAGNVVMGRTADNGEYKILKVDNNGGIVTSNSSSFVIGGNYSGLAPTLFVANGSNAVIDTYLGATGLSNQPFIEGLYNVSPFVMLQTTTNQIESVNVFLVRQGSGLANYFATINPITDNFAPVNLFNLEGLVEFWHNITLNNISNITNWKQSSQANLQRSVFLYSGNYTLYITANSPFIFNNGQIFLSATNIQKIG